MSFFGLFSSCDQPKMLSNVGVSLFRRVSLHVFTFSVVFTKRFVYVVNQWSLISIILMASLGVLQIESSEVNLECMAGFYVAL